MLTVTTKDNDSRPRMDFRSIGLYSYADAASILGISTSAIYTAISRGRLTPTLTSLGRAISESEIARYRQENLGRIGNPTK